jgi:ATP synthase protein I
MDNIVKTARLATLGVVIVCLVIWAIIPSWSSIVAGVILGTAASALNALLLRRRIELLGQIAASSNPRRMSLGTMSRLATFDIVATLIACFYVQAVIFVAMVVSNRRYPSGKE